MNVFDLHCDTASLIFEQKQFLNKNTFHVDLEKMQKANYCGQWFAFFVNLGLHEKNISPLEKFNLMYDYFINQINQNKDTIEIVSSAKQYLELKNKNKISAFLSLEEGEIVKDGLHIIDEIEQKGVTLMTLTWNVKNSLGYPHSENKGLNKYGKEVVNYLNIKNILLDVSHLSDQGTLEVLDISKKPVIASHSNAKAVYNTSRNLNNDLIRKIAISGGVIGINFYSYFLNLSDNSNINDILKMINYVYKIGGSEVVALGTDFDGINCNLEVSNCGEMEKLINTLSKLYPIKLVEKFMYKNVERIILENF
ncbi:hypothetical protein AN640_01475 [Candidatus Epulonipiscium fishelsonii]|uniref:Uncharacterized protein n=1 Tax=Candidatus Epulonipiscium fishelsonii TaxID=77094 RepID=A0ACC8XC19_9FIRM|nr:hypothetical protein AN640_01475 [Epulopiscium sp. SCG-D08WGA-EpuloA1]OON94804.1 MAG: hypothetical protein ATN32_07885 [Epulopiscium sp. AS2M-Bin002]